MVERHLVNNQVIITLSPNRSANWRQNKWLILVMAVLVMLIASIWALLGVWLILPFAGLEIGLLALLSHRACLACYQQQVITIRAQTVDFAAGVYRIKQHARFLRQALNVNVTEASLPMDLCQMRLGDKQQQIEFGQFLNQADRKLTLNYLQQAGIYVHSNLWWQTH